MKQKSYSKKFITYGIGQAFNLISPLLVLPYLVKICGEEGFGKIGVGFSISFILIVIVDFSSYHTGIKQLVDHKNNVYKTKLLIVKHLSAKLLLFLLVIGVVSVLMLFPYLKTQFKLILSSLVIVFSSILNPNWILQAQEKFLANSVFNVASKLIYLISIFLFINTKELYFFVPFLYGIGIIIPSVYFWIKYYSLYQINFFDLNVNDGIQLIKADYKLCLSQLFFAFRQYSPVLIIDFILGSFVAGQFRIIEQLIMIFRTFFQILFRFSFSVICNLISRNLEKGVILWKKINSLALLFVLLLVLIIYTNSFIFLKYFNFDLNNGKLEFLFKFSLLLPLFIGSNFAMEQLLFSFNKIRIYNNITYTTTLISFTILVIFTIFWSLFGAILALLITELFLIIIYTKFLWQNINPKTKAQID